MSGPGGEEQLAAGQIALGVPETKAPACHSPTLESLPERPAAASGA